MIYISVFLWLIGVSLWYAAAQHGKGGGIAYVFAWIIVSLIALCFSAIAMVRDRRRHRSLAIPLVVLAGSIVWFITAWVQTLIIGQRGSNRLPCPSHLKQIGAALILYSRDHEGRYPERLEDLVGAEGLDSALLICPDSKQTPASSPDELRIAGHPHCSYIFPSAGQRAADLSADSVVAYEPVENHVEGANILFGDGSVVFIYADHLAKTLAHAE